MRVPFIIRWPGEIRHRRHDLLLSAPDIYPTLMDLMGLEAATPDTVEGTSHADIFRGDEGARPTSQLYLRIDPERPAEGKRGLRTRQYTLMIEREGGEEHVTLHDNSADPYQLKNIASDSPALIASLSEELNRWLQKTNDPWAITAQ